MKKLLVCGMIICCALFAKAQNPQDTTWKYGGVFAVNLSQVSLSNWSAGGQNTVSFDFMMNYDINYKFEKRMWLNRFEFGYGLNKTKNEGTKKTNDRLYISSNYGYKIGPKWYVSVLSTFNTQFAKGFNYPKKDEDMHISKFMAPGYLSVGTGFTWIPNTWLTASFSPAAWRGIFVTDSYLSDLGAFGVKKGKKLKSEFGGQVKFEAKKEILPNMKLYSRLELFSDYLDKPRNIDILWDVQLNMQINKWVSANIATNLLYDHNTKMETNDSGTVKGAKVQFKEVLSIGIQFQI